MNVNEYAPFLSEILRVKKHTEIEYTFSMSYKGQVKPGQFLRFPFPGLGRPPSLSAA